MAFQFLPFLGKGLIGKGIGGKIFSGLFYTDLLNRVSELRRMIKKELNNV